MVIHCKNHCTLQMKKVLLFLSKKLIHFQFAKYHFVQGKYYSKSKEPHGGSWRLMKAHGGLWRLIEDL